MDELLKNLTAALNALVIEMRRSNDLAAGQVIPPSKRIAIDGPAPSDTAGAPEPESAERKDVKKALDAKGIKFHGKTSTDNLKKLLAESDKPAAAADPFETAKSATEYTINDVKAVMVDEALDPMVKKFGDEGKAKVLALLGSVAGVAKLTEVPKEKYAELIDAARKLVKKELGT